MPHDPVLRLLGLARKAGRLAVGEEPVGAACRSRSARLILVAENAAPNTFRRCAHFGEQGGALWLPLPRSKEELGFSLGRSTCAMVALTDAGLAAALVRQLSRLDPERYGPALEQLEDQARRVLERQKEQRRHEKNLQRAKKKPWAMQAPPQEGSRPQRPSAGQADRPGAAPPARRAAHTSSRRSPAGAPRRTGKPSHGPGPKRNPKKRGGFT